LAMSSVINEELKSVAQCNTDNISHVTKKNRNRKVPSFSKVLGNKPRPSVPIFYNQFNQHSHLSIIHQRI